ncbi:unnamed protein product [Clonostachys byssicola]|uniref:DNA repair exonuclease rad1 n=1 Tax=Clonostachys byssicola TaxID=160290 RepID=A0A9N9UDG7_9HYPO|nr:unnamed protein product [Clonostachys byssicola]
MDSSLHEVWQAAAGSPFLPTIGKESQFTVGFLLLLIGVALTGYFALNRSLLNVPLLGVPASAAIAVGTVYMFCAVGVYKMATENPPIFRAVATSTRPLYQLLRCIDFAPRVHVQITEQGIRFTADLSRVMQGVSFLGSDLFYSYTVNLPREEGEEAPVPVSFQIPLGSLLEVLQIFGAMDVATRAQKADQDSYRSNFRNYRPDAFSNHALGLAGTCTFLYTEEGDSFKITIEESGVKTTAALTTYVPEIPDEIPFDRDDMSFKIIMQARSLLDSLSEITPTSPSRLTITASRGSPYLSLAGVGDLGSSAVDFARGRDLMETFSIQERFSQSYKFDFIKHSTEGMRIASKVSLRGDRQGVLNLQLMVITEGDKHSFLDFRFVPFIQNDGDEEGGGEDEEL